MTKPQNPELRRSGNIASFEPDNVAARLKATDQPTKSGPTGPVPPDNQPGHHPEHEESKPDMDDFVERFNRAGHDDASAEPEPLDSSRAASDEQVGESPDGGLLPWEVASRFQDAVLPATRRILRTVAKMMRRSAERLTETARRIDV